ncbi:hypothetical protein [Thermomonospora catenispora]|uniref:hypothetical protein n=1 Tax=Thermomonospora catenispora TaxID=2493090 RepID=UPI0011237EBB|nr:hypothetical protein [Thermomonospora catenispora]TNY37479.1 hypothetical protein EIO00_08480 [Thermomonospora catenispora]
MNPAAAPSSSTDGPTGIRVQAPDGSRVHVPVTDMVSNVVEAAACLGAAALGRVIGNRADAGAVAAVRRMFENVRQRWRERSTDPAAPLSCEEAVEAARAAVLSQALSISCDDLRATRQPDGSWRVVFYENLHPAVTVTVPAGDPGRASIVVVVAPAPGPGFGPHVDGPMDPLPGSVGSGGGTPRRGRIGDRLRRAWRRLRGR